MGVELRNDSRFHAIERMIEPAARAARLADQANGGNGVPFVDWPGVLDAAADLRASGRDLRLLVIVARALANESGPHGLATGLSLLERTLREYWDALHPVLREGAEPAIRRVNALRQIESADEGILCDLEFNPLFRVEILGVVTGGDLAAAALNTAAFLTTLPTGLSAAEQGGLVSQHDARVKRVAAACKALAAEHGEEMAALRAGLAAARAALEALEAALAERLGKPASFPVLSGALGRMAQTIGATEAAKAGEGMKDRAGTDGPGPAQAGPVTLPDRLESRAEVERCLDLIIAFYEAREPASPLPHLARRMRRMVPMNFLQLIEEVAPGGVKDFRALAGVIDEKSK